MATYTVIATRVIHERVITLVEADSKEAAEVYLEENEDTFEWEYNGRDCFEVVSVQDADDEAVALLS